MSRKNVVLKDVRIVNEGTISESDILIGNGVIQEIGSSIDIPQNCREIDAGGKYLLPGVIDDQVHFREPGLTHKATIYTESKACVAGGITSFMEMPNTKPTTTTIENLERKFEVAATTSLANHSFFFGATNDNLETVLQVNPSTVCGIKVFMGSSTGNMLVDNKETLEALFANCEMLIATHCEDEATIRKNIVQFKHKYAGKLNVTHHPKIRSREGCYISSSMAVELAKKHNTRLHILHISTKEECTLFEAIPLQEKRITAEACMHHMWFCDEDYKRLGTKIQCNPAIKSKDDRAAIRQALKEGRIDIIATDHAPHTKEEKNLAYPQSPSGLPLVQFSLQMMMDLVHQGEFKIEDVAHFLSHQPARCFNVKNRGFIREGYFADLVLVKEQDYFVKQEDVLYKCGWSPLEGHQFAYTVDSTFVNGNMVYHNGKFDESVNGMRLLFDK